MIKKKKMIKSNQGNSFIVVVATISFLAVLTTALLVAVALCYRLKAYDINTRDNFYYLEQAMDEIYEGVGAISMKHLNEAFDETSEVIVYYDTDKKSYVTMNNSDANKLMKAAYVGKLKKDTRFDNDVNVKAALESLISNKYDSTSNSEGVQISVGNPTWNAGNDVLTLKDVVLKREAQYSTVNTKKSTKPGATSFIQSITTDITIGVPDFEVDFNAVGNDISELYDFALISDMGVEISGIGVSSNITGNVYAAADFYNKEYNKSTSTGNVQDENETTRKSALNNKINSYSDTRLTACNGVNEKSMYSGFYVSGAKVSIMADKLIVPGSIASMNCASVDILGSIEAGGATATKVWSDGIVLGGYSRMKGADASAGYTGSSINMKADSYVYDDLEVNAVSSAFSLDGSYYGYNYASTDNRTYSSEFISASTKRKYTDKVKINDGNYIADDGSGGHLTGQAHYNSSSVVVNGNDATLDLSNTDTMYIAGQAYVEMSKSSTPVTINVTTRDDGTVETAEGHSYAYEGKSDENYTRKNNDTSDGDQSRIQDYRTGEGLSVKSNQLAYIPPTMYDADELAKTGNLYVKWPSHLKDVEIDVDGDGVKEKVFENIWDDIEKIPVIKTVRKEYDSETGSFVSREYYFYDFSKSNISMNVYMAAYAQLFDPATVVPGYSESAGSLANFFDITDYDLFKVKDFTVVENLYSNSAISMVQGSKVNIIADSKKVQPLLDAKNNELKRAALQPGGTDVTDTSSDSDKTIYATKVTTGLQNKYKEMKMLLTDESANGDAVTNAYAADEGSITPINYYFNFEGLNGITSSGGTRGNLQEKKKMDSGYWVFLGEGDVNVTSGDADGRVKGIVICKGDVTFDSNVKEFEGLIVSGGKIIVDGQSINFVANAEIIKSILRECDESSGTAVDYSGVCKIFRHFVSEHGVVPVNPDDGTVQMRNVTSVQYEDILAFKNWKKNVD